MDKGRKYKKCLRKTILGAVEPVYIDGKKYLAKIDTGADSSSMCTSLVKKLRLGKPVRKVKIRSSHGRTVRKVYKKEILLGGKKIKATFSIVPRTHMNYLILIGKRTLRGKFIIDVSK